MYFEKLISSEIIKF